MPPLSAEQKDQLGKQLRERREDIFAAIHARTDGDTDDRPAISPMAHMGSSDDAPVGEMLSHNEEHLAEHDIHLLQEIDTALSRLDAGTYGVCVSCGVDIPEARLVATPTVQTCIACQERIEKETGLGRGPSM
jgi:RNA polymerase-binding protein DksA